MTAETPVWLSPLNLLEFQTSLLRMIGTRDLEESLGRNAIAEFERMVEAGVFVAMRPSESEVWKRALELTRNHTARLLVHSLDILEVAYALELQVDDFWTFDMRQRALAQAAGLRVNP